MLSAEGNVQSDEKAVLPDEGARLLNEGFGAI